MKKLDKQKVKAFFKKINPVIRVKMFLDSRIKKAVERNLNIIFHKYGEVSVDHHMMSDSWAVIKVADGPASCYLKFLTLDKKDLKSLCEFLSQFDRAYIDSSPDIKAGFNRNYRDWFCY